MSDYLIARGLDGATRTMSKFQFSWSELASSYQSLWNATYEDTAVARLEQLVLKENELSSQASTEAPKNQERLGYSQEQIFKQRHLISA